jgi:tetratricopeptide (TPR) repeat protein
LPASEPADPSLGDATAIRDGDELVLPCRAIDGRIIWVSIPRRTFLHGGLGAAALTAIATAGSGPLGASVARLLTAANAEVSPIETLRQLRRALIDADNLLGPSSVLPAVHSQIQVIRQLRAGRRGADRQALLTLQAQYAEFAGWLHQDARDFQAAGFWLDRALEWSHAATDRDMATYVMARKSQLAGDMCDAANAVDLANAASGMARKGSRLKATAATYGAHGYALAGQHTACFRAIDGAREMTGRLDDNPESPWATWLDNAYIDVQRGRCLSALGDHAAAAAVFQQAIRDLPPAYRRDRGVYLAREALAHAEAREPEQAAGVGMEAVVIAHETQSGRVIDELARVGSGLAPWATLPAVADFQDALTSVLPTERTG